jgi:tRNA(adenine34) deaminase
MNELNQFSDKHFMQKALDEARKALDSGEIPVGAIVTVNQRIIARGHNMVEKLNDATAHAEMIAITAASEYLGSKYLNECTLYVTLEPCAMCASAMHWAQFGKLVYAASDPTKGFCNMDKPLLHPKTTVISSVMANEAAELLKGFFAEKRK